MIRQSDVDKRPCQELFYDDKHCKGLGLTNPRPIPASFVVPGGSHGQGQALTEVNWFAAITNWVEMNLAPEQLVYNKTDDTTGIVVRTLPVCQHPKYPRYNGGR